MCKFKPGDVISYQCVTMNASSVGIVLWDNGGENILLRAFRHGMKDWSTDGEHWLVRDMVTNVKLHPNRDTVFAEWVARILIEA